jgi:hypothetical protein
MIERDFFLNNIITHRRARDCIEGGDLSSASGQEPQVSHIYVQRMKKYPHSVTCREKKTFRDRLFDSLTLGQLAIFYKKISLNISMSVRLRWLAKLLRQPTGFESRGETLILLIGRKQGVGVDSWQGVVHAP